MQLGRYVLGAGSAALGAAGLTWGAFAFAWQAIPPDFPAYRALAYLAGTLLVLAGIGICFARTGKPSALMLTALYALFAIPWAIRVVRFPQLFGVWGGLAEMVSLALGAVLVFNTLGPPAETGERSPFWPVCIKVYGVCAVVFGFNHFFSLQQTADMVPAWLPPNQTFWAVVTGVFHCAAGVAILLGIRALTAAWLLGCMMLVFELLVWLPGIFKNPDVHLVWAGNAVDIALAGAAFVVADTLARMAATADRHKMEAP